MLEKIIEIDTQLFLFLNGLHSDFFDPVMIAISGKLTWIPLYLIAAIFLFRKFGWKKALILLLFFGILITAADQISVRCFKNVFQRLRPTHNIDIEPLTHYFRKGGMYGFVSSHAANSFAFAVFSFLIFRYKYYTIAILIWAVLVSYSRIYLGVHFPGDIIGGAILGTIIAIILYKIYIYFEKNLFVKINEYDKIK